MPVAPPIEQSVLNLFALVREAMARATWALLNGDMELGQEVVDGDQEVDELTAELELEIWSHIEEHTPDPATLRQLVGILLIVPELERSADLAEHIAQRALTNIGAEMTPVARGIVQRMSEVAAEMWQSTAAAYVGNDADSVDAPRSRRGDGHPARPSDCRDRKGRDANDGDRPSDADLALLRAPRRPRSQPRSPHRGAAEV